MCMGVWCLCVCARVQVPLPVLLLTEAKGGCWVS